MLAYVYMDPESALNSQRVYFERQHEDGYINYRTGAYLDEVIEHEGERTASGPFYSWINHELFQATGDRVFLEEAYASGARFYEWWLSNRDKDGDGLVEWGGHAVLESLRDGLVAVWHHVGWPSNFEALDLNVMLVKEARSLAEMARALGDADAAERWDAEADTRTLAANRTFWDEETGFFYHVDRDDHNFTFSDADDLKRQEIIGFLPLWAGTATEEQAARLVGHLTNKQKFWRPYGVPSLAADDPYYDPTGYWNGPVWPQWQYLIVRGLLDYGYTEEAQMLADKLIANVTEQLRTTHTFWELYSPDHLWGGHHQAYIWTGLVARMLMDLRPHAHGSTAR
jgi:glycogen debranching enzyme